MRNHLFLKNIENLNFKIKNISVKNNEIKINIDNHIITIGYKITCTCSPSRKKLCKHSMYFLYYHIKNLDLIHKINYRNNICLIHLLKDFNEQISEEIIEENHQENHQENCPICLNNIKKLKISCTKCNNKFHVNCITKSLNNGCENCSVCRSKLDFRIIV